MKLGKKITDLKIGKNTALVVIDLQKGIATRQTYPYSSEKIVENAAKLSEEFRSKKLPVFLVHVLAGEHERLNPPSDESFVMPINLPSDWAEFMPQLKKQPTDIIITKKQWEAFYRTELELQLKRRKIGTIVLCGIATNIGVESTARFAYEFGFNQIFAEDAMGSLSEEAHYISIKLIFKRLGLIRTTDQIINAIKNI